MLCSLRQDETNLSRLKIQLSTLWGNLEEIKTKAAMLDDEPQLDGVMSDPWNGQLSNVPFECCIEEYGQMLDPEDRHDTSSEDFIRLFQMTNTSIM